MSSPAVIFLIVLAVAFILTAFVLSIVAYIEATKEEPPATTKVEENNILTTKGDLFGFSTANARVPVGSDFSVLVADSSENLGLKYSSKPIINVVDIVNATPFTMEIGTEYNFRTTGVVAMLPLSPPFGSQVMVTDAQGDFNAIMNQVQVSGSNRLYRKGSVQPGAELEDLTINNGTYTITYVATDRWIVDGANLPLTPRAGITEDPAPALDNSIYSVLSTTTPYDFTLPPATGGPSRIKLLYPSSGGTNNITIKSTGVDTINNSTTPLAVKNNSVTNCISTAGNWFVQIIPFTVATVAIPQPEGEYNTSLAGALPLQTGQSEGGSFILYEDVLPTTVAFAHTAGTGQFRAAFYQTPDGKDGDTFDKVGDDFVMTPTGTTVPVIAAWAPRPILKVGVFILVIGRTTATACSISRYDGIQIPLINSTTNNPVTIGLRSTSFTTSTGFIGDTTFPNSITNIQMEPADGHSPVHRFF